MDGISHRGYGHNSASQQKCPVPYVRPYSTSHLPAATPKGNNIPAGFMFYIFVLLRWFRRARTSHQAPGSSKCVVEP